MAWECWGRRKQKLLLSFLVKFSELLCDVDKEINRVNFEFLEDIFINMRKPLQVEVSTRASDWLFYVSVHKLEMLPGVWETILDFWQIHH